MRVFVRCCSFFNSLGDLDQLRLFYHKLIAKLACPCVTKNIIPINTPYLCDVINELTLIGERGVHILDIRLTDTGGAIGTGTIITGW